MIVILIVAVVVLPLISVLFYQRGSSLPPRQRLAGSAHALLLGLTVPYGLTVDVVIHGQAGTHYQLPIYVSLLLAAASMLYSFWAFRSQPILYLAHIVTIVAAFPAVFVASVAVVGWT